MKRTLKDSFQRYEHCGQENWGCKKTAQIKKTTNLSKKDRQVVFFVV